ncbi:two-component system sensor histidine kinase MtrB [Haloactinopolyspora alba]|uniref:histidine kinase n=1 Tax=Haloactinopolyspora alba TaxID=648780 RepID=A0A2P8E7E5_9ACTN|nr:HAMP domain-containing sensor histidine kinase [Haloactinopolyspora alba]PSL05386.1 two-component system sensor histidine kinase MtrB [Haloactinopolyspora alba]
MTPRSDSSGIRRPSWLIGLRARLMVAFLLVTLGSGMAAAGLSYVSARNALLDESQVQFLTQLRDQVADVVSRTEPASGGLRTVAEIADRLNVEGGVVVYADTAVGDMTTLDRVPARLRTSVRQEGRLAFQRTVESGEPFLYAGTPVTSDNGTPTGIEVYAAVSLAPQQQRIDALARQAAIVLSVAAVAAVVVALVAARSVLRPVRALGLAAARLGAGDLTTRLPVRGNDELAGLVRGFNDAAAGLEDSVTRLRREEANSRRFVADVSHELRTPLSAMTAVTDTLDEEAARLGGDGAAAAGVLSTETHRLAELVENLIEISRFDAGSAELHLREIDARELVERAIARRGWSDAVELRTAPGTGRSAVALVADPRRLDVVVANLVGNAVTHGAEPITVTVSDVPAARGENEVTISVHDDGPGMPPEVQQNVFGRFYKADASRGRSDGSGLGMAIAWENVRLHGGRIDLSSSPGEGTRFTVRLPRDPRDRPGQGPGDTLDDGAGRS